MHTRRTILPALLLSLSACALPSGHPPSAEFLVSASDATYWVQSGTRGVHIRRSPLILARAAGRYYELYVEEVDRSYTEAVFTGERIFRRDIATGDSAVIFEDSAVLRRSSAFHRAHPDAPSIGPKDDLQDDVGYSVEGETDILNVLGPYVAVEHRLAIDHGSVTVEDTSRTVIDLRSGRPADIAHISADSTARDATGIRADGGRVWHNDAYDVRMSGDSGRGGRAVVLRDNRGREWRLGILKSPFMRVFWLDKPRVGAPIRRALIRAFNEATTYGEPVRLVSQPRPAPIHGRTLPVT
jgi:hypothetical protein